MTPGPDPGVDRAAGTAPARWAMATDRKAHDVVLRVVDAIRHPHGGYILRLRLDQGEAPSVRRLKGSEWWAFPEDERDRTKIRLDGFAAIGGKASDERVKRTGRMDVHVSIVEAGEEPIDLQWRLAGPLD